MQGKKKLWLAIAVTALTSPLMCGGSIGMAMGEAIQPDGSVGQEPWQFFVFLSLGFLSVAYLVVCICLTVILVRGATPKFTIWLVRAGGLSPIGGGVAMLVAAGLRVTEGLYSEAAGAFLIGLAVIALGWRLLKTREQEFGGN